MCRLSIAVLVAALSLMFFTLGAPAARAQVTGTLYATVLHPFVVGNTSLPAGKYEFHMVLHTQGGLTIMHVYNTDHSIGVAFMVRPSLAKDTPKDNELQFARYGRTEVLTHIYEMGSKHGEAIIEPSHIVDQLKKQGQKSVSHLEQEPQ